MKKEIKPDSIWDKEKMEKVKSQIKSDSKKQSLLRKIKNKYLSIKYKLEDLFKF